MVTPFLGVSADETTARKKIQPVEKIASKGQLKATMQQGYIIEALNRNTNSYRSTVPSSSAARAM